MCGVLSPLFIAYVCSYIFIYYIFFFFFFFKQKTAYEMRISDWSSDVCSSDLLRTRTTSQATLQASSPPPWNCLRQLLPTSFPDQDLQARRQDRRCPTRRCWSGFWKIDRSELRSALSPRWPRMLEYRPSTDVRLRRTQRFSADSPQDICS